MKKLVVIFPLFLSLILNAQTFKLYETENFHNQLKLNTATGEVYQIQDDGQKFLVHEATSTSNEKPNRYALFKTQNMWTFILLDKWTGLIWQCQFSVQGVENIGSLVINPDALSYTQTNKFTIQPMTSMFQYYLINEETGDMWQFQWNTNGDEYRWIKKM